MLKDDILSVEKGLIVEFRESKGAGWVKSVSTD